MKTIGKFLLRVLPAVLVCAAFFTVRPEKSNAVNYGWAADFQRFTGENGEKYYKSVNYKVKIYNGHGGFTYHDISGGTEVRRFELVHEMTGERKPAYCIAPGLPYTWLNIYNTDTEDDALFRAFFNTLPKTAREGISYALMFGYQGDGVCNIHGANAGDFWMATQAIIWEYQQGIRTDPYFRNDSGLVGRDVFYDIVRGKSAEICYDRILADIAGHVTGPGFCVSDAQSPGTVYTLYETSYGSGIYQANLADANPGNTRAYYAVNEAGERLSYISVSNIGKLYTVRSTRAITSPEVIKLVPQETYMKENTAFFFSGGEGEQPLVSGGHIEDPFCQYITVETKAASMQYFTLNITKQEENGNVSGIPFLFQWSTVSGTVQRTAVTDQNGTASVSIPSGMSSEALSGMIMYVAELGDEGYTAVAAGSSSLTVLNTVYFYQTVSGKWAYDASLSNALAAGGGTVHAGWAIFPNFAVNGNVSNMTVTNTADTGTLRISKTSETDSDELFCFLIEGLDANNSHIRAEKHVGSPSQTDVLLPVGRYRISEILPEGSSWTEPEPQIITVSKDTAVVTEFVNSLKKCSVLIEKRSEDNDFSGVSFCIRLSDGSYARTLSADDGEGVTEYNGESVLEILTTGLSAGTYTVTEMCPDRYVPVNAVTVAVMPGETACVKFNNVLKRGDVMLIKNDADSNVPVPGAFYTLYRSDGTPVSERLMTDRDGCIRVGNLEWGRYYFIEEEAPYGYAVSGERTEFSVDNDTYGQEQVFHVTDRAFRGSIRITKSIRKSDIVMKHGRPVFAYSVSGLLSDGSTRMYCLYAEFTEEDMNSCGDTVEKSVILCDIPAGTYTVSEKKTNRYDIGSVTAVSGSAAVRDGSVVWTMTENDSILHVLFSNIKTDGSGLSHTDLAVNEIGGAP